MLAKIEAGEAAVVNKADCHPFWWLRQPRDAVDKYLRICEASLGVPKGRPPNTSGPFGNEPALPAQFKRKTRATAPIRAGARRIPSQHEIGASIEELDEQEQQQDEAEEEETQEASCIVVGGTRKRTAPVRKASARKKTAPKKKTAAKKPTPKAGTQKALPRKASARNTAAPADDFDSDPFRSPTPASPPPSLPVVISDDDDDEGDDSDSSLFISDDSWNPIKRLRAH
ncbi:hypothetical protein V8F06_013859 [Rhypophila decipiens]